MLISGVLKYFKSLSVGPDIGSIVKGLFTGMPKKTTLIYADSVGFGANKILEIDATLDFTLNMETKLLETPAENQVVYTNGALRQPKTITIKCYVEIDKMNQLRELHQYTIPVWVVCEKPIPSTMNQRGYYTDASLYAVQTISITNDGFENCVACNITLREIHLFDYRKEYLYDLKQNKINKGPTNKAAHVSGIGSESVGHSKGTLVATRQNEELAGKVAHNIQGQKR